MSGRVVKSLCILFVRIPPRATAFLQLITEFLKIEGFLKRYMKLG